MITITIDIAKEEMEKLTPGGLQTRWLHGA